MKGENKNKKQGNARYGKKGESKTIKLNEPAIGCEKMG
jgi:hypothetical protein